MNNLPLPSPLLSGEGTSYIQFYKNKKAPIGAFF